MRCLKGEYPNHRVCNGKGVRKVGSDGDSEYSVCPPPALSIRTAARQPAGPMQGGGVCGGAGVTKVRAEPSCAELS